MGGAAIQVGAVGDPWYIYELHLMEGTRIILDGLPTHSTGRLPCAVFLMPADRLLSLPSPATCRGAIGLGQWDVESDSTG